MSRILNVSIDCKVITNANHLLQQFASTTVQLYLCSTVFDHKLFQRNTWVCHQRLVNPLCLTILAGFRVKRLLNRIQIPALWQELAPGIRLSSGSSTLLRARMQMSLRLPLVLMSTLDVQALYLRYHTLTLPLLL